MPVDEESLAGWVAVHGVPLVLEDAYAIPEGAPYRHNDAFDVSTGFRTRAMLVVPMNDHRGELVGVLQLMNRVGPAGPEPYPADLVPLLLSLATQAAVCLKANHLTASIRRLFEDFAQAAIVAVEQRDPTTAGHSNRVASLTVEIARLVDRATEGPYAVRRVLPRGDARDLHGGPSPRLRKDLDPGAGSRQGEEDRSRRVSPHPRPVRLRPRRGGGGGRARSCSSASSARAVPRRKTTSARSRTRPTRGRASSRRPSTRSPPRTSRPSYRTTRGALSSASSRERSGTDAARPRRCLLPEEFRFLSITQGSLSAEERLDVESHVTHTWRFLSTIPWTPDLARVPGIAYAHHEKLDGSGYPRRLRPGEIPPAARALTVCDIYDALTASDRPYKKAMPRDRALEVLEAEAARDKLDRWMVRTFIAGRVWTALAR